MKVVGIDTTPELNAIKFDFEVFLFKADNRVPKNRKSLFQFCMYYSANPKTLRKLREVCKIICPRKKVLYENRLDITPLNNRYFWADLDTIKITTQDGKEEQRLYIYKVKKEEEKIK